MEHKVLQITKKVEIKQSESTYRELTTAAKRLKDEAIKALDEAKIARENGKKLLGFQSTRNESIFYRNRARSLAKQAKYLKNKAQKLTNEAKQIKALTSPDNDLRKIAEQKRKTELLEKIFQAQENIAKGQKALRKLEIEEKIEVSESDTNYLEKIMNNYKLDLQTTTQSKQEKNKNRIGNYPLNTLGQ